MHLKTGMNTGNLCIQETCVSLQGRHHYIQIVGFPFYQPKSKRYKQVLHAKSDSISLFTIYLCIFTFFQLIVSKSFFKRPYRLVCLSINSNIDQGKIPISRRHGYHGFTINSVLPRPILPGAEPGAHFQNFLHNLANLSSWTTARYNQEHPALKCSLRNLFHLQSLQHFFF